jgi:outer membrane protein
MGYDADDADSLSGMDNRDISLDGGVQLKWVIQQVEGLSVNIGATTDLMSKHEGQEVTLAGKKVFKGKIYQIIPEAGVKWQSSDLVDYYYGVRDSEVASGRPAYEPDSVIDPFVASRLYLGLSENWILISRVGYEFLGAEIQDSPIVDKDGIFSMLIGVARRF